MKKSFSFFAIVLTLCLLFTGCTKTADDAGKADQTEKQEETQKKKKPGKKKNEKKADEEARELAQIPFRFISNPYELRDSKKDLASGNYYVLSLEEAEKEAYPELAAFLEEYSNDHKDELMAFFDDAESDLAMLAEDGVDTTYATETVLHPVRSDEKVFSFVEDIWEFYGGAHGTTRFVGYHIDPITAEEIKFDDVVTDVSDLPGIVMEELIKQNEDLEEYFEGDPQGKEELEKGLPERFSNNAEGIAWTLGYDGIELYFEDYAMGTYVAGARSVQIRFADYPELFTNEYNNYADAKEVPDIGSIAIDDGIWYVEEVVPSYYSPDGGADDGEPVEITKDMQKKLNLFISNFVEQGFPSFDRGRPDYDSVAYFTFKWAYLNKYDYIEVKDDHYAISLDKIQKVAEKYLGLKVSEDDLKNIKPEHEYDGFYEKGYYYMPLADGESYTGMAVVDSVSDVGGGMLRLNYTAYEVDLDLYLEDGTPDEYYTFSSKDAKNCSMLTETYKGYAIVEKDGNSYKLYYYE